VIVDKLLTAELFLDVSKMSQRAQSYRHYGTDHVVDLEIGVLEFNIFHVLTITDVFYVPSLLFCDFQAIY
jgi:hypothetical protein